LWRHTNDIKKMENSDLRHNLRKIAKKPISNIVVILAIFILLNIMYPQKGKFFTSVREGEIAEQDVIAPFTFPIRKEAKEIEEERKRAIENVLPVVDYNKKKTDEILSKIDNLFTALYGNHERKDERNGDTLIWERHQLSKSNVQYLRKPFIEKRKDKLKEIILEPVEKGIIYEKNKIPYTEEKRVSLRKPDGEIILSAEDFYSLKEAKKFVENRCFSSIRRDEEIIKAVNEMTGFLYTPNLRVNIDEIEKRRREASASVSETKGLVLKGEMIVRAHDQITKEIERKLNSLNKATGQKENIARRVLLRVGLNIIFFLILACLYLYVLKYKNRLWKEREKLLTMEFTMILFLYLITFVLKLEHVFIYLIPISFLSMIFSLIFGELFSLVFVFTLSSLIAVFSGMHFPVFIFLIIGGMAGTFAVKGIKRRTQLYKAMLIIAVVNILLVLGIETFARNSIFNIIKGSSFSFINAVASVFLVSGLVPIFEKLTKTVTNITLFEWSDLNLPLLKKLSVVAPGSYNHSIVVGNLAEAAAGSVGVNSILTRVASYYHDIGKMSAPGYFIENQMGTENPHAKISPYLSGIILISHVREGVKIAKQYKIPDEIIKIIREHHGTSLIVPFYEKARKDKGRGKVEKNQFRYRGPLPSSKESGIVMLADSVEAASRSIEEPTAKKLRSLIDEIIDERFRDGQLNNTSLTLVDLKKIGDSFLPILLGIHHLRIEYPKNTDYKKMVVSTNK
jgi:putative nucleotidyltransferase with HDIG domain